MSKYRTGENIRPTLAYMALLILAMTPGVLGVESPSPTNLPKVLIIGDSISLGYTPFVKQMLADQAEVVHHRGNAGPTIRGLEQIDAWLGDTRWDVIHFNWGLWDMYGWEYVKQNRSPAMYERRLEALIQRLERTHAKLIWATTTPACPKPEMGMQRRWHTDVVIPAETEQAYLGAAARVMALHNIPVNDLHAAAKAFPETHTKGQHDVHFTEIGSRELARQVAAAITQALETKGKTTDMNARSTERVTLDITEFGARPDSGEDASTAVRAALVRARELNQPVTLRFPKGQYDFFKENATRVHLPITAVHREWDHFTPLFFKDLDDVTLDGNGSLFLMHGRMTPMIWYRCERVTVNDLAMDQRYPTVQEAKVVAQQDKTVDFRVHPDTRYQLGADGRPVWLDADGNVSEQPNVFCGFNARENVYSGAGSGNVFQDADRLEELEPGLLRCRLDHAWRFKVGDSIQWRWHIRNQQGMIFVESSDILLQRVKLHASNGLGMIAQLCHNVAMEEVHFEPRQETGRTAAMFADCFHVAQCTGTMRVERCRFNRMQDDAFNIHGFLFPFVEKESPRTALIRWGGWDHCGFNMFFEGDQVGYRDRADLRLKGTNTVVSGEYVDVTTLRVTLQEDLPEDVSGLMLENLTRIPDRTIIRDNYFGAMTTRGFLMNTGRNTLIEGNEFHRMNRSAILAKTPDGGYHLQNCVDGLVIRNNTFIECHGGEDTKFTPGTGIIFLNLQTTNAVPGTYPHRNVVIEGNRFINRQVGAVAVKMRGLDGLTIKDNTFETLQQTPHLVTVFDCANVNLSGNTIDGPDGKASVLYGQMDPDEITAKPEAQWTLTPHQSEP